MTSHIQVGLDGLEAALADLSQLYPDLRFGQLIEMVAVLAGEESPENPFDIEDSRLLQTATSHLSTRFPQLANQTTSARTSLPSARTELIRLLHELRQRYPGWRFAQLVSNVAGWSHVSLYDAEDQQLLAAARQHLA